MKNIFKIDFSNINREDLWSNEKKHFRLWIGLFLVFWTLILILTFVYPIYLSTAKTEFIRFLERTTEVKNQQVNYEYSYRFRLFLEFLSLIIPSLTIVFFSYTLVNSYKQKTFIKLSGAAIMLARIHGILSLINIIQIFSVEKMHSDTLVVLNLVVKIIIFVLSVIQLFFIVNNVAKIKRLFVIADFESKTNAFMEEFNKSMKNSEMNSPFWMNYGSTNDSNNSDSSNSDQNKEDIAKSETIKKLLDLPNEQLYKMSEMLNIFGYKEMTKEELVEIIYNHTKKTENSNKN
ncbi:hypothetical protein MCANUFG1_02895 [Mycoplasmopsis canis UFG1]|uniref:hypothetical protein n=1 Tax=Mycoplasmopsis canis TaxID=29555 RepID=UPI00025B095C|nr:hypothetical protein [Mycoplasmopsis canis]EIE41260.1 hypothetical protein MCANUFG1_02895 [Mycoplasmopsis canis UFG1]